MRIDALIQPFPRQLHVSVRGRIVWLRVVKYASSIEMENVGDGPERGEAYTRLEIYLALLLKTTEKREKSSEKTYYVGGSVSHICRCLLVRFREVSMWKDLPSSFKICFKKKLPTSSKSYCLFNLISSR